MAKLFIKQIPVGQMMNYCYLVGDADSKTCAVIDPGWDAEAIVKQAAEAGMKIEKILLTHTHFDHANAVGELAELTGAKVFVHRSEVSALPAQLSLQPTDEGSKVEIGGIAIECLHTPGHTPGSQCFLVDGELFTGDTLFVDACGRVDLPGSDPRAMAASLKRLAGMDPKLRIHPGHDYGPSHTSTIGDQLKTNPYLNGGI